MIPQQSSLSSVTRVLQSLALCALFSHAALAQVAPAAPAAAPVAKATPGRASMTHALDATAAADAATRRAAVAAIKTRAEAETRQAMVRKKILALIGELPERTPLHAETLGSTQATGFRIEKVLFESQPGFKVTALLYLPDGKPAGTKLPAILMAPGHGATGKAGDYNTAASFARNGFVVLSYDPIGQGERLQYPDPAKEGTSLASRPTGEHGEAGLQPTILGDALARYFVWDAMRGIDYLSERPEVDAKRIGAYGCSGGGAMTALTAALDTRVAAAGVACYNTSFDALLPSIGPQDGEQSIPHFIASGFDFPDWIELVAPRPYAAIATYSDMFPFSGALTTVTEARRFYSLFDPASAGTPNGAASSSPKAIPTTPALNTDTNNTIPATAHLQFITGPGGHGALAPIMGDVIAFFIRNLQPGADVSHMVMPVAPVRGASTGLPADALQVTRTGQIATSYPHVETVFTLNQKRAAKLLAASAKTPSGEPLLAEVRKATGTNAHAGANVLTGVTPDAPSGPVLFKTKEGVELHGQLAVPAGGGTHPAVILLVPDSIDGASPIAHANKAQFDQLAAAGNVVLALTPSPSFPGMDDMKSPILGPFYLLSLRADLLSRTILGLRVDDVVGAVDYLTSRKDVEKTNVTAAGSGHMGLVLLHTALLDKRLKHVTIDHALSSYRSLLDAPMPVGAAEDIVPGAVLHYDLPDIRKAVGARLTETAPLQGTEDLSQASTPLKTLQ